MDVSVPTTFQNEPDTLFPWSAVEVFAQAHDQGTVQLVIHSFRPLFDLQQIRRIFLRRNHKVYLCMYLDVFSGAVLSTLYSLRMDLDRRPDAPCEGCGIGSFSFSIHSERVDLFEDWDKTRTLENYRTHNAYEQMFVDTFWWMQITSLTAEMEKLRIFAGYMITDHGDGSASMCLY